MGYCYQAISGPVGRRQLVEIPLGKRREKAVFWLRVVVLLRVWGLKLVCF